MLTDEVIRKLKPERGRIVYATHHKGIQLSLEPSGTFYWRYHYRFKGAMQTLILGKYPQVSIKAAERRRAQARVLIDAGVNPRTVLKHERSQVRIDEIDKAIRELERVKRALIAEH